jgi:hypothetical protein
MADERRVTIVHPQTGVEFSILPKDFTNPRVSADRQSYADQGFHITRYVTGEPYEGPKTKREVEREAEAKQAAHQQAPAAKTAETKAEGKGKD